MLKKSIFLSLFFLLLGCSSDPYKLNEKAQKVKVLKRKPKRGNSDCIVIDKFNSKHENSSDLAMNKARNWVADKDGDSVYFDDIIKNGKKREVVAVAYKCN